jgi:hypothetical protein
MRRIEDKVSDPSQRLKNAISSGILGQFAYCLTESAALIDRKRLKAASFSLLGSLIATWRNRLLVRQSSGERRLPSQD